MFPAYAGMDRITASIGLATWRVPRLRGDGPLLSPVIPGFLQCSPPTRGWTVDLVRIVRAEIVFPAYAGMDRTVVVRVGPSVRVPRLRGDGPVYTYSNGSWDSCSPPTRGWTGSGV